MDLNELATFAKVVETESFTRAAENLGVPKSTISRKVSQLEERLGVRLLDRTTRKVSLTEAGEEFFERATQILKDLEEAELAVTQMQSVVSGTLRVTAPIDFGIRFLGDLVTEFLGAYEKIQLELDLTDRVVDLVSERFDVAIRAGALPDSSLIAKKVGSTRRNLVASPAYLEKHGRPESIEDLSDHQVVHFGRKSGSAQWSVTHAGEQAQVTVHGRLAVTSFQLVTDAAVKGLGIGLIPALMCAEEVENGALEIVLPECSWVDTPIHAVYPSARFQSKKVQVFIDFLTERFSSAPWNTWR